VYPPQRWLCSYRCVVNVISVSVLTLLDIKPDNVLFNYKHNYETDKSQTRFADIKLADFGSCVSIHSEQAQKGELIGAPIFRSPEATLRLSWGTATDIWSFGAMASPNLHDLTNFF
jgi:serine/threonine protein kinase